MPLRFNFTFLWTKYCRRHLTLPLCCIKIERPFVHFLKDLSQQKPLRRAFLVSPQTTNQFLVFRWLESSPSLLTCREVFPFTHCRELDRSFALPEIQEHPCDTCHRTFPGAAETPAPFLMRLFPLSALELHENQRVYL